MSKIDLRGVIVPSHYDNDHTADYIDKGLITPESRFRDAVSKADKEAPLSIHINSPGGSVFAANEMINAVQDWKRDSGQPVNVTVGAMAASAASTFAVSVADNLEAHRNAKMMFHGAYGGTLGGKEAHADTAKLLGQINNDTKQILIQRYKMQPEQVDEWFAEGREGWLTAGDMQSVGIASSVLDDESEPIQFSTDDVNKLGGAGLDIAAMLEGTPDDHPKPDNPEPVNTAPDCDPEESSDYKRGYASGLAAQAETVDKNAALLSKWQAENDKIKAENATLKDDMRRISNAHAQETKHLQDTLEQTTAKLNKLLQGALSFEPGVMTWEQALRACDGDYAVAANKYPELRKQFMLENRTGLVPR